MVYLLRHLHIFKFCIFYILFAVAGCATDAPKANIDVEPVLEDTEQEASLPPAELPDEDPEPIPSKQQRTLHQGN